MKMKMKMKKKTQKMNTFKQLWQKNVTHLSTALIISLSIFGLFTIKQK